MRTVPQAYENVWKIAREQGLPGTPESTKNCKEWRAWRSSLEVVQLAFKTYGFELLETRESYAERLASDKKTHSYARILVDCRRAAASEGGKPGVKRSTSIEHVLRGRLSTRGDEESHC